MHQLMEELPTVKTIASKLFFHSFDFFRIYSTIQFLTGRYADQAFNEIARYGARPPADADHYRKTSGPIMLGSAFAALVIKSVNAMYYQKNNTYLAAQDYVYALFSSSIIFFVGDLFSSTGYMPSLSPFAFAMISLLGVLAMMAIFLKLTTPISSDKMIFSKNPETQLSYFEEFATPLQNPSKTVRVLNAVGSVGYVASLSTFFWVLNHEISNGASPLSAWQKGILGLGAVGLAVYGSRVITDHPKCYLLFLMAVIFLNMSAITYSGVSTLACYVNCQNHNKVSVIVPAFFAALFTGLFSAGYIDHRTENTHAANQRVEEMIEKAGNKMSSFFNWCKQCCQKEDNKVDEVELLEISSASIIPGATPV